MQLLGDLTAGFTTANDQDPARTDRCGVAIGERVKHRYTIGKSPRGSMVRPLERARAHNDGVSVDGALRGRHAESLGRTGTEAMYLDAFAHRNRAPFLVTLQVGNDVVAGDMTLGVVSAVGAAR